jgi:hypothetical protein
MFLDRTNKSEISKNVIVPYRNRYGTIDASNLLQRLAPVLRLNRVLYPRIAATILEAFVAPLRPLSYKDHDDTSRCAFPSDHHHALRETGKRSNQSRRELGTPFWSSLKSRNTGGFSEMDI